MLHFYMDLALCVGGSVMKEKRVFTKLSQSGRHSIS